MAEEKKEFPWIQLIATVGTIIAALIGITPYLLKLNTPSSPTTPTIVIVTLPPAATTPAPVTTAPVTAVETTPAPTATTVVTTVATAGPPPTGNETVVPTTEVVTTVATTMPPETTIVPTTAVPTVATTLPPGPALQIAVNTTSVVQGGYILASGTTDPSVSQVLITLTNSTGFQSAVVPVPLTQGAFQFEVGTAAYAPGDYTISAAVPDTTSAASASFLITPP